MKVVIVDYGMGNLRSISSALSYIGVDDIVVSSSYLDLSKADKLILPGVGSFKNAMSQIKLKMLNVYLNEIVIVKRKPILGICLGMQLMGLSSTEESYTEGLKFVNGTVTKFDETLMTVPHVGFNQIRIQDNLKLFEGISDNSDFYFTHSFRMLSNEKLNQSECDYNGNFIASFEVGHIAGVQFHPELSQHNGLKLLKNFIKNF